MTQRLDFIQLAQKRYECQFAELCRRFKISRKSGYKWLQRFREHGEEGLRDRSRRPHTQPNLTEPAIEKLVLDEREQHPGNGPRKLHRRLQNKGFTQLPTSTTFARTLQRHHCIDAKRSSGHKPVQRFERARPNELWQMDFKGHFALGDGRRCHPLTVLGDHSRYLLVLQACENETDATVRAHLLNAFALYGLPDQILCDNGSPWGAPASEFTSLGVWLLRLGVRVIHGRPLHPQTQGKDERFDRSLKDELLCRHDWPDLALAQKRFDSYRHDYNHHRPHQALEMSVPSSRYTHSTRSFNGEPMPMICAHSEVVRTVKSKGEITFQNRFYY